MNCYLCARGGKPDAPLPLIATSSGITVCGDCHRRFMPETDDKAPIDATKTPVDDGLRTAPDGTTIHWGKYKPHEICALCGLPGREKAPVGYKAHDSCWVSSTSEGRKFLQGLINERNQ